MVLSRKFSIRIADLYFDERPPAIKADVARYVQWSRPAPAAAWVPYTTRVIDLTKDSDALVADMEPKMRYTIRRTERDELVHCVSAECPLEVRRQFCDFYDQFAALKGLRPMNRRRVQVLAACSSLYLTQVKQRGGATLAWHAYWRSGSRVRLWHSATLHRATADASRRALIGRANRYHIWHDMLAFKEAGFLIFDLGGWYTGADDREKLAINFFKKDFGGQVVETFNGVKALSLKGRLAVWIYERLGHAFA
ncbi:MAG TPA: hypothetical protein VMG35_25125 [Bryobacteraceae bacterium]|nr:hypothetical protein [Bryobacteraceae bacterium]